MRGDAGNVAFWPEFVHSSLRLRQVQHVLIEKSDPERLAFTFLSLALSNEFSGGTTIIWRDDLPPETAPRCHIAHEGGAWIQRDGLGRIYGTHP